MRNLQNANVYIPSGQRLDAIHTINKMDILFYNSVKLAKQACIQKIIFYIFLEILLVIFLPIDVLVIHTQNNIIIVFMATAIAVVTINLIISICLYYSTFFNNAQNNRLLLLLAELFTHSVVAEPILNIEDVEDIQNCVSQTVYNQSTGALNNSEGLTKQIREKYQTINSAMILNESMAAKPCISCLESNGKFLSFLIIIFGIVALISSKPLPAEIVVLTIYIILQAISIWFIIIFVIILGLLPIIVLVYCIFSCCCMKDSQPLQIPQPVSLTPQMIEQTDGSCSICMQIFKSKEQVIILRCSSKHLFHTVCLQGWLKISDTCPMCRKKINQD